MNGEGKKSRSQVEDILRARTAAIVVGIVLPLVSVALTVVLFMLWRHELPDPMASHWGPEGAPDGSLSFGLNLLLMTAIGAGLPLLMTGTVLFQSRRGGWSTTNRFMAAMALWSSTLLTALFIWMAAAQRGIDDWRDAPDIGLWVFISFGIATLVGALAYLVQPAVHVLPEQVAQPEPLDLAPSAQAVWFGEVTLSKPGVITLACAIVVVWIAAFSIAWNVGAEDASAQWVAWFMFVLAVLMTAMILVMVKFRVHADERGFSARSIAGWPKTVIPVTEIADVKVVDVQPFAEFGGWGWRTTLGGRSGIVLRAGKGIEVMKTNGSSFVVTVDGAEQAVAVLGRGLGGNRG